MLIDPSTWHDEVVKIKISHPLDTNQVLSNNVRIRVGVHKFGDMPTRETVIITEPFDFAKEFAGRMNHPRFGSYTRSTWIPRMRQEIEKICL